MSFKWCINSIEHLIINVQQHPCLYNVKHTDYVDRLKKSQAFNIILEDMQKLEPTICINEIKRKWRNLRTQFMKEQRLINHSKKSGSGVADVYTPKLWCFKQLQFLQPHIAMRPTIDNTGIEENNAIEFNDEDSFIEENPRKKSKTTITSFRNELDSLKNVLIQKKGKKFAWLGNLVAAQMEKINPEDQDDAAWQVQCLMRRLTRNSANTSVGSTSSSKDILELSMEGLFDEDDEVF